MKKFVNFILYVLLFVYFVFEELVWNRMIAPLYEGIKQFKIIEIFLDFISKQNEYIVLFVFLLSFIPAEWLGYKAAEIFATGKFLLAILVYSLKVPIGIIAFAVLKREKEKLFKFGWFKAIYEFIEDVIDYIKDTEKYKNMKSKFNDLKNEFKKLSRERSYFKKKVKRIYQKVKIRAKAL